MPKNHFTFFKVSKFISLLFLFSVFFVGCNHEDKKEEPHNMNELSDELISNAKRFLNSKTKLWDIIPYKGFSSWLRDYRVICIIDSDNKRLVYLSADNKFWRLNCSEGIASINKILMLYSFSEENFSDADKTQEFSRLLLDLYQGPDGEIASKSFLRKAERLNDLLSWMQGEEKDKSVFRNLCFDPVVKRENGDWNVTFNFINSMGGVERWVINGNIEKNKKHPQVHNIKSEKVKENGTFYYPIEG